ncbi:protein KASH5 isoform X3 [Cinclus cinclus]|uniref:protein KASH5 isoform X3 n=1 Tax=Cinclus cinclus TaxID=127875 RepID=UPI002E0F90E8
MGGCRRCGRRWILRPQGRHWTGFVSAQLWAPGSQRAGRTGQCREMGQRLGLAGPVSSADPWLCPCRAEQQDVATGDTGSVLEEDDGHALPAAAQLQGDNIDITTHSAEAAGLRSRARQLAAQNTKLQRDAEQAEELNAHLAEEIAQLQAQLRSRQALEQARVAIEELDEIKAVVKGLEEENTELRRQARHTEKEQHSLCLRAEGLQEENQRLLAEGQGLREQIQAQAARMSSLEAQVCRDTALLSARDTALAQAGQRAQELTAALEDYERVVQELRLETTQLRQQLGRLRDAWAMYGGTHAWGTSSGHSRVLSSASSPSSPSLRRPWCPRSQLTIQATAVTSQGTGDKEEEEDTETALFGGGGLAGSSEEVAEAVAPQAPLSPWTPLSPWALALLVLLALLYLLPRQWPQPQLRYQSPPPL